MRDFDLEAMSLKELKGLQKDLAKAIARYAGRARSEARNKVEALAKEMGFALADLVGAEAGKTARAPARAKYRHPENPARTWSGRGRQPRWFTDYVDAGKDPNDLAL